MKFIFEDEEWILIVIKIFIPFLQYNVISPLLHSCESEDTIFDPGITAFPF